MQESQIAAEPQQLDGAESDVSIRSILRFFRSYAPVIFLILTAVAAAYSLIAVAIYVTAPGTVVTSQPFRLEFQGAAAGTYPNGTKFGPNEIISMPLLLQVHEQNDLKRFIPFQTFAHSIFILEQNPAYDRLVAEYQTRLSDPRLNAVDRERIQSEFDSKRASLNKNEYSLNFTAATSNTPVPKVLVEKTVRDILEAWAHFAAVNQRVLNYNMAILSPEFILATGKGEEMTNVSTIFVLRSKVNQVLGNISEMESLPGIHLVKTRSGRSLQEIRYLIEDNLRFQIEPLVALVNRSAADRARAIDFLESQLAYDQRELDSNRAHMDAIREALAAYATSARSASVAEPTRAATSTTTPHPSAAAGETVMPQISDSFIDRLVQLSAGANDQEYRKELTEKMRLAAAALVPLEAAVAYDKQILATVRAAAPGTTNTAVTDAAIDKARNDLAQLTAEVNEIYQLVSRNLSPSTHLYSTTGPPSARFHRAVNLQRLALYGVMVMLAALVFTVIVCFLHWRVRQEESSEAAETEAIA